jgi:hypothetical protein
VTHNKTICGAFVFLAATASIQVFASKEHKFGSDAEQYCPKLPDGSGYCEWEWAFSVDWGHCVGRVATTRKAAFNFGIARLYGVMPPGELEPKTSFVKSESVGGTPVRWYRASVHRGAENLEYRTITLVDEQSHRYLDVSVYANSELQMNERLDLLERLKHR